MRALVQRVKEAQVSVNKTVFSHIKTGLLVLVGIAKDDELYDISYISGKILNMRIFPDAKGNFNYTVKEREGSLLLVSQFTLYGDVRKGRRPDFFRAASAESARKLYDLLVSECSKHIHTQDGVFGEYMEVSLVNDGPCTILLDSKKNF